MNFKDTAATHHVERKMASLFERCVTLYILNENISKPTYVAIRHDCKIIVHYLPGYVYEELLTNVVNTAREIFSDAKTVITIRTNYNQIHFRMKKHDLYKIYNNLDEYNSRVDRERIFMALQE